MREIKFRAWDYKINEMRCWEDIRANWTFHILDGDSNTEIMQYTGLQDKNGKEIYEGDIVREVHVDPEEGENKTYHWPVIWLPKCAAFGDADDTTHLCDISGFEDGSVLIIGNIYQNPELLK